MTHDPLFSNAAATGPDRGVGQIISISAGSPKYRLYDTRTTRPVDRQGIRVGVAYQADPLHNPVARPTAYQVARFYYLLETTTGLAELSREMKAIMASGLSSISSSA